MNAQADNWYYPSGYYYGDPNSMNAAPNYPAENYPMPEYRMQAAPNYPAENYPIPESRRQAALNASSGSVGPLPIFTTLLASPLNVVSTTIDTLGMRNTNNLLKFTSIINLPVGISVTFNFQIHRVFNNGAPIGVGSTYTFSATVNFLEAESFEFQFLDENVPEGSYTYSVNLSTNSIVDITPGATINAVLSVLAVAV
jgi:hypothetical protein